MCHRLFVFPITQYSWQLKVVTDAGEPSRAWVDYPGRIWVEGANQGAIYSPDGSTLPFGTIWQRTRMYRRRLLSGARWL